MASSGLIAEMDQVDRALYAAVAGTPTPSLDRVMRGVSTAADYSRLSILSGVLLALLGGARGRRAAVWGLSSVASTAAVANLALKPLWRRRRPDSLGHDVPLTRRVRMPRSHSWPSGHTATAVAFASGASRALPIAGLPLSALAAVVGYARVHTGVHYPGDVVAGAVLGAVLADLTTGRLAARAR